MINYVYIILALTLALVLALAGIIALAWGGQPIPDVLQNIAVGSLTALAGVLVPVGLRSTPPRGQ